MTTPSITYGQQRQIISVVEAAAGKGAELALQALDPITRKEAQRLLGCGDQVSVAVQIALAPVIHRLVARYPVLTEMWLLKPIAMATAAKDPPFVNEFFRTRHGLDVRDSFHERFDLEAPSQSTGGRPYVASLLKSNAYDRDIRRQLPENHLSTLEDIAGFIEDQPNGKKGVLLTKDYANIFYVLGKNSQVFVVYVCWYSATHRWVVRVFDLGENGEWSAWNQVLCPGNAAL